MTVDDEIRVRIGLETCEPRAQEVVEHGLADPYRGIRPDRREPDLAGDGVRWNRPHVVEPVGPRVVRTQLEGPLVHVDRPHRGGGGARGECERDRAGTAPEIREVPGGWRRGRARQKMPRAAVEHPVPEDAVIGGDRHLTPRDPRRHRTPFGAAVRLRIEVVGAHALDSLARMPKTIRTYGDPVLNSVAAPVDDVDGKVIRQVNAMLDSLYASDNGLALAAPQIGIQRRIVVWDIDDEPMTIINPEIVESDGEWVYDEGCLSIPGLYVEIARPARVHVRGLSLDGETVEWEVDEILARMFQHEIDHLHGVLMFDRMQPEQRREAIAEYRRLVDDPRRAAEARHIRLQ